MNILGLVPVLVGFSKLCLQVQNNENLLSLPLISLGMPQNMPPTISAYLIMLAINMLQRCYDPLFQA